MSVDEVRQVERFLRTVIQWISQVNGESAHTGRSLGEYRLLCEIGVDGADLPRLVSGLKLSGDAVSLLVLVLEDDGLVDVNRRASDGQMTRARLTTTGRTVLQAEERRVDVAAERLLTTLNSSQRGRLTTAMRQVERLLRASAIDVRVGDPHHPDFQACLDAYFAELADRYGGFDPNVSRTLAPDQMVPPAGLLMMAYHHDHPVGCGALNFLSDDIGAIKRMWVSREYRGLGIGSRILDELEYEARKSGVRLLRLENRHELYEATQMYTQSGYRQVEPFNDEFYADRWYEKMLL
jgi:GNAT superfamily N-acetyltransferase